MRNFNVLLLGTDGTGKSTLTSAVASALGSEARTIYLGMGQEGWFFDTAQRLYYSSKGTLRNHAFWYIVFPLEIVARRIRAYSPSSHVMLIDRFPGNPFLKGHFIRWIYRLILPKPDLVVVLHGDPEALARRKPGETTKDRASRDIQKWKAVARSIGTRSILELDTTVLDLNECRDRILAAIRDGRRC